MRPFEIWLGNLRYVVASNESRSRGCSRGCEGSRVGCERVVSSRVNTAGAAQTPPPPPSLAVSRLSLALRAGYAFFVRTR